jgi:hypothetical protein
MNRSPYLHSSRILMGSVFVCIANVSSIHAQVVDSPVLFTESGKNITLTIKSFGKVGQTATLYGSKKAGDNAKAMATATIQNAGIATFTIPKPQALTFFRVNSGTLWSSNAPRYNMNLGAYSIFDQAQINKNAPALIYAPAPKPLATLPKLTGKKVMILFYGDSNGAMGGAEIQKALSDAGAQVTTRPLNMPGARTISLNKNAALAEAGKSPYYPGLNNFQGLERALAEVPADTTPIISLCSYGANNASDGIFGYDWRGQIRGLCKELKSFGVPVVAQFHAGYSSTPLMDFIQVQTLESTKIAREEGLVTPTDAEAADMIASFYLANQSYYAPNPSDGIHYNTHAPYHGKELAPLFARAISSSNITGNPVKNIATTKSSTLPLSIAGGLGILGLVVGGRKLAAGRKKE